MALLFLDSFDHYTAPADKYTTVYSSFDTPATGGRHGKGMSSQGCWIYPGTVASARCIIGAAWYVNSWTDGFFSIWDGTQLVLSLTNALDGTLRVTLGTTVSSPVDTLKLLQWYFIELDVTLTTSGGNYLASTCKVYVDGLLVINVTNLGPGASAANASAFLWTGAKHGNFGNISILDDFYVLDGAGPAPWNAPLGDVQIDVIRPNGVGASTQWSVIGAAANWAAVRDTTPDDDATRVSAATAGLADLYQMEDINTNNGIIGAQLLINARRTEEGYATLTPLLRHAGTTTSLVTRSISPSYFYRNRDVFVTMPNGDPLTDVNVQALQAGFRRET